MPLERQGVEGDGVSCGAASGNPHQSGHFRARVSADVYTRRPKLYPTIYVYPWLKHKNDQGNWVTDVKEPAAWQNELRSGKSPYYAMTHPSTSCPNNKTTYRSEGYHYVVFGGSGGAGFAYTANSQAVECQRA